MLEPHYKLNWHNKSQVYNITITRYMLETIWLLVDEVSQEVQSLQYHYKFSFDSIDSINQPVER